MADSYTSCFFIFIFLYTKPVHNKVAKLLILKNFLLFLYSLDITVKELETIAKIFGYKIEFKEL